MDTGNLNIITGNRQIDFEHAQIFSTLATLEDITMSQSMRIGACEKLLHYISDHCRNEEDLMNFHQYPDKVFHEEKHRDLQDNFLKTLSAFIKQGGGATSDVHKMFYDHIFYVDMPMIRFIQTKNSFLPKNVI
jgi:hemerythrin-like metal-binding protein